MICFSLSLLLWWAEHGLTLLGGRGIIAGVLYNAMLQ